MSKSEALAALSRRDLLGALAAAAFASGGARAAPSPSLRALLDRAAAEADPARRLAMLRGADVGGLGRTDAAVWRMVVRGIEREQALRRAFPYGRADGSSPYVLSRRHGAWLEHGEPKPGLAARLDEETARLRADAARGIAPPDFIIASVLEGQRAVRSLAPDLAAAFARQTAALEALRPAPGAGVWRVPGGAAYYAQRLRCTTGSEMSPAVLDRRVRLATRALLARADGLLKRLGLARGSVGARLRVLKAQARYPYTNDESGRARAVADMNLTLARLRPHLATWFNPPFDVPAEVRRMAPGDELAGRRGYREPPAYYPDLSAVADRPDFTLATVACHETIPGHLLQLRRQAAADPHPLQLRYAAGYAEGWAIYAESLADRIGLFSPVQQLGFLQSLLFRLARVTADIGLHVHRWERAQAIRYLEETMGFELFFPFAVEVDRYCDEPAGFAGDAAVALLLRERAPAAPAAARRFHDAILDRGPLSVEAIAGIL
ncbi:MAG TPA: DUF885 family protein [Allosphingosinicella sp.]